MESTTSPLILHIIHRLAVGGLENGLVNLINRMPKDRYRHAIVCLTDYTDFRDRLHCSKVPIIALGKREGKNWSAHLRVWQVIRRLKPAIVHTRNLPTLEYLGPAALAGVPCRIHGEHGRDVHDSYGASRKFQLMRKAMDPWVHRYTAVSHDLADWLVRILGTPQQRVTKISNGVDVGCFYPRIGPGGHVGPKGFAPAGAIYIGTVGRMQVVKDQVTLVRAFLHIIETIPWARKRVRLIMVGDGPLRKESLKLLREANLEHLAWLPGEREDIPEILRALDVFVLPSLAEGISNTILEAMASGLPVVATKVGGNSELVEDGRTGLLVPPSDPRAMADAIRSYLMSDTLRIRHGQIGRKKAEHCFSLESMVRGYMATYDEVLGIKIKQRTGEGVLANSALSHLQGIE